MSMKLLKIPPEALPDRGSEDGTSLMQQAVVGALRELLCKQDYS